MNKRPLGNSGLEIAPLVLGGNVFGWTVDERSSFDLLDAFFANGLNAIDTADSYSMWVDGNRGGESETIIGKWLARSGKRNEAVIITKVGSALAPDKKGLSAKRIVQAAEDSLRRLQIDCIDVYLSHFPDAETPIEETLRGYETLQRDGKVKAIGCSNYNAAQLREALHAALHGGLPRYEVLQPEYNLYERSGYEGELRELCVADNLGVIPYFGLASGFLTGKYRSEADLTKSVRGRKMTKFLNDRGMRILGALDAVAEKHDAKPAEVALAWLIAREGVTAPIASATTPEQLESLIAATRLTLGLDDLEALTRSGALDD
jgi:aryl-alcohol dehydrogenase-like predicted oxidoreductase